MPKINTHLYFAEKIVKNINDGKLKNVAIKNKRELLVGSIFPDIFFYRMNKKLFKVSEYIHGKEGNKTNELVFDILDIARGEKNEQLLAFVFGYISHMVLDATVHPMIYYLSGNYYDDNNKRQAEAVYQHIRLETMLDKSVTGKNNIVRRLRSVDFLKPLENILQNRKISLKDVKKSNKLILFIDSKLLNKKFVYYFVKILAKSHILDKRYLGLFYAEVKNKKIDLDRNIKFRDLVSGKQRSGSFNELLQEALEEAILRIRVAQKYFDGKVNAKDAKKIIKGENLSIGREGVSSYVIKYTKDNENEIFR